MLLIGASMLWTMVIHQHKICYLTKIKRNLGQIFQSEDEDYSEIVSKSVFNYGKNKTQNAFSRKSDIRGACICRRRFLAVKWLS